MKNFIIHSVSSMNHEVLKFIYNKWPGNMSEKVFTDANKTGFLF